MIDNPNETQSDSFFFAEGKLIVHNKAAYDYNNWKREMREILEKISFKELSVHNSISKHHQIF